MQRPAVRVLSSAWFRGARSWWVATIILFAAVLATVVCVLGVFEGMQEETQDRVGAVYTGDLRVTPTTQQVAPSLLFPNGTEARARLEAAAPDANVAPRLETSFVLSRRTLLEAYLFEQDQYTVGLPGTEGSAESYGAGVLVGLAQEDDAGWDAVRSFRVSGALPSVGDPDVVQVMMTPKMLHGFLDPDERAAFGTWPPAPAQYGSLRFEITAARIDPESEVKDLIRFPARVVGLYETRLDTLDRFTAFALLSDVQRLLAAPTDGANVFVLHGDTGHAQEEARQAGWATEDAEHFAGRYIGELVAVLEALSVALAALFFVLPFFLLWHGIGQQLDRNRRELAVCRAIGLDLRLLGRAMAALTLRIFTFASLGAVLLIAAVWTVLGPALPHWDGSPLPVAFAPPYWAFLATFGIAGLGAVVAWLSNLRNQHRLVLTDVLRAG